MQKFIFVLNINKILLQCINLLIFIASSLSGYKSTDMQIATYWKITLKGLVVWSVNLLL